jgi:hypothetical protein
MHPNFYHWHTRAELKPEINVLEPRWDAVAKFAAKAPSADLAHIVQAVSFSGPSPDFAKRVTEVVIKTDPTFLPANNFELVRVMAAAAAYAIMEENTNSGDAIALGLQAASFGGRSEPVCSDVTNRAIEYLAAESERIRPKRYSSAIEKAEAKIQGLLSALKTASEAGNIAELGKSTEATSRGIFSAVKDSHEKLGMVIDRMAEETQFLWWLLGSRSSTLDKPRKDLSAAEYALPAAQEAAERVSVLPPPASAESLLDEVLSQTNKSEVTGSIADLLSVAAGWVNPTIPTDITGDLTPVMSAFSQQRQGVKIDSTLLKKLRLPKAKLTAFELSRQYFRELIFIRALTEVD